MKEIKIYGLFEDLTGMLRYIGITKNSLQSRFYKHRNDALSGRGKTYKDKWLKSVYSSGNTISILQIDECNASDLDFWEDWNIEYYRSLGCKLTNTSAGGYHPAMSKITRDKISKANKGKKKPEGFGDKIRARVLTEETKEKLRAINTGRKMTDESKAKMKLAKVGYKPSAKSIAKSAESRRGIELSEETKTKISLAHKGKPGKRLGHTNTDEHNIKISKANKGKVRTDEAKALISKRTRESMPSKIKIEVLDSMGIVRIFNSFNECARALEFKATTLRQAVYLFGKEEYKGYTFNIHLDSITDAQRAILLSAKEKLKLKQDGNAKTKNEILLNTKIRKDITGANNFFFGKKHDENTRKRISEAITGRKLSEEHKAKLRGKTMSDKHKETLSKPIAEYSTDGGMVREFESIQSAADYHDISHNSICKNCNNNLTRKSVIRKTGTLFRYKNI